jgi:hypothetical protein
MAKMRKACSRHIRVPKGTLERREDKSKVHVKEAIYEGQSKSSRNGSIAL